MQDHARILVVDDERNIRELLEICLGDEGYDVRTAPDGQVGLQIARDWPPDAIVPAGTIALSKWGDQVSGR